MQLRFFTLETWGVSSKSLHQDKRSNVPNVSRFKLSTPSSFCCCSDANFASVWSHVSCNHFIGKGFKPRRLDIGNLDAKEMAAFFHFFTTRPGVQKQGMTWNATMFLFHKPRQKQVLAYLPEVIKQIAYCMSFLHQLPNLFSPMFHPIFFPRNHPPRASNLVEKIPRSTLNVWHVSPAT